MAQSPVAVNLTALKQVLQDLETAVQEPRDTPNAPSDVIQKFPVAFHLITDTLHHLLKTYSIPSVSNHDALREAHTRGWLRGDLSLWLRLASDYQNVKEEHVSGARAQAIAQDVRACSCLLWETYQLLNDKFRWQTQITPAQRLAYLRTAETARAAVTGS